MSTGQYEPLPVDPQDNLPDDFKYGTTVATSDISVRLAFMGKVYSILGIQLLATSIVAASCMYNAKLRTFVQTNPGLIFFDAILTMVFLLLLLWKRNQHPLNLFLLSGFTLTEAFTVGAVVSFYEHELVLQALLITLGIFLGLTLYTLQSKRDFSGIGTFLIFALWGLLLVGLVNAFIPFSSVLNLVIALISVFIFCGYIVYDTYNLMHRLSCEEYIIASVELYLDVIGLFLNILRILSEASNE